MKTDLTATGLTMSSLEIAGLCGKRHQDVLRDARNMADKLEIDFAQFCAKLETGKAGRPTEVMNLPKRESLILVSGYSVEMRARIIDRWMELEAAVSHPDTTVTDLSQPVRSAIGGIVRDAVRKQLTEILPAMVEAAMLEDHHAVTTEFKPALDILCARKVPTKKRRGFSQKISSRLRRFSAVHGYATRVSRETSRYLFHVDAIASWLREEGERMIAEHVAALSGQGVFRFVGKAKP